jgi:preprotein translocase subunit Sec61beta|tara:strand:- start:3381 stop:3563 length:183 start_codon:yes stop_codon:yes gene_type:complete
MSSKKGSKKDKSGQMPASQAGLLTFFGDDSKGIKLSPIIVMGGALAIIVISIALRVFPII